MHAWALIANKNFLEAENWLNAAKEIDPKNPRTFLNLGLLAEEQARFEDAKSFYKKSYELGKSTRHARNYESGGDAVQCADRKRPQPRNPARSERARKLTLMVCC